MNPCDPVEVAMCLVDMHFSPHQVDSAVQVLSSSVGATRSKRGCQACTISRDTGNGSWVRYSETWNSEEAFRRHLRSEDFRPVIVAIEMCCEEPTVLVGNLSGHRGVACLQGLWEEGG